MARDEIAAHRANHLLAAMQPDDLERLLPRLEVVAIEHRTVLIDAGEHIRHVYFVHSGVICLMAVMQDSGVAETATIGCEGMVGFEGLLNGDTGMSRALVQVSGSASRIPLRHLREAVEESATLRHVLFRYVRAFLVQVAQSVACNGLHSIEERCCRWLLMAHDRAGRDTFNVTQEFLAEVLGVRRPSVTTVARTLQSAGVIRYSRGVITISDRKGVEDAACECYRIVKHAFDEILPKNFAHKKP